MEDILSKLQVWNVILFQDGNHFLSKVAASLAQLWHHRPLLVHHSTKIPRTKTNREFPYESELLSSTVEPRDSLFISSSINLQSLD